MPPKSLYSTKGIHVLKAGIFLDMENLNRCGGYAIRFRQIKALVEAQQAVVVRANAYMAVDREREKNGPRVPPKEGNVSQSSAAGGLPPDTQRSAAAISLQKARPSSRPTPT